jgi:NAD(P)-dependent dehydrogenase (short-subunit alcohol dehydrogenase family)
LNLKPIQEQVVVIVGANSGIGRETALQFAERGAKVVIAGRSLPALTELVNEIQSRGGEATSYTADVSQYEQMQALADYAVERYGRIDTWVHAAAVSIYAPFQETRPEEFRQVIEVNLIGQAFGAMAALPHLKRAGGGALIHIGSVESKRSFPLHSAQRILCLQTRDDRFHRRAACGVDARSDAHFCDDNPACGHQHAFL